MGLAALYTTSTSAAVLLVGGSIGSSAGSVAIGTSSVSKLHLIIFFHLVSVYRSVMIS